MKSLRRIPKKFLFAAGFFAIFVSSLVTTYVVFSFVKNAVPFKNVFLSTTNATSAPTPKEKTSYSILLVGHGGAGHDGGGLADSIMLVSTDTKNKATALVAIPRDTWISSQKINNVFVSGASALKQAVQTVTGLEVDYFVAIDFSGLEKAVDTLGGVDVEVPVTFNDYFYPIKGKENESCGKSLEDLTAIHATMSGYLLEQQFTCRYEHLHFDKGITKMDGKIALKFVRSRHSEEHGGDFARSERQQALLMAIKKKALSLGALKNIPSFFNQFAKMIRTDLDANVLQILHKTIGEPETYKFKYISLSTDNIFKEGYSAQGAYILIPKAGNENWGPVHDFIRGQLIK